MIRLPRSLAAWRTPDFRRVLREELATLAPSNFPLAAFVRRGDRPLTDDLGFDVEAVDEQADRPRARIGVFFDVVVACCSCGDEPVLEAGHASIDLEIDPTDASVRLRPVL